MACWPSKSDGGDAIAVMSLLTIDRIEVSPDAVKIYGQAPAGLSTSSTLRGTSLGGAMKEPYGQKRKKQPGAGGRID